MRLRRLHGDKFQSGLTISYRPSRRRVSEGGYLFQSCFGLRFDQVDEVRWAEFSEDWERFCSCDNGLMNLGFNDSVLLEKCQKKHKMRW